MNEINECDDNNFNDKYKYLLDKNIKKKKCRPCNIFKIFNITFFQ